MRYPPGQKDRTRERVLNASAELIKKKGFAAASVDELMAAAGLTGGTFYAYFPSKNALLSELIRREMARTMAMLSPPGKGGDRAEWLGHLLGTYLNHEHVKSPEAGCVIPALGAEIARADPEVRRAFEESILELQSEWAERLGDQDAAWSLISQLVGAVMIGRAMASKAGAERVINANRNRLGHATTPSRPKRSA